MTLTIKTLGMTPFLLVESFLLTEIHRLIGYESYVILRKVTPYYDLRCT